MQNERVSLQKDDERTVSQRTRYLVEYLENLWQRPHEISGDSLKRITDFIVHLPEPYQVYQSMAMSKIAEYLVNIMGLHFLHLVALFQEKAGLEGIDTEEHAAILHSITTEVLPEMMSLSKHVVVRSIDDLVTLSNITFGLYTLSQVETAEDAQNWLYELPILYRRQLVQERLVTSLQAQIIVTRNTTISHAKGYISWDSSLPAPIPVSLEPHRTLPTLA